LPSTGPLDGLDRFFQDSLKQILAYRKSSQHRELSILENDLELPQTHLTPKQYLPD
jgi:hypothetical protein